MPVIFIKILFTFFPFYCILWKQGVTKTGSGSPFAKYLHFEDFQYYRR